MPKYIVGKNSIIQENAVFKSGSVITLTEEQAEKLDVKPVKNAGPGGEGDKKPEDDLSAKELIEKIKTMTSVPEVAALFTGEDRVTVKDALKARIKELKNK